MNPVRGGSGSSAIGYLPATTTHRFSSIAQESLNNVRKHAKASFVHLFVDVTEPSRLVMSISDDGGYRS